MLDASSETLGIIGNYLKASNHATQGIDISGRLRTVSQRRRTDDPVH